eukprot:TRINITY_DN2362_c0_g1_i3.p1 TRINITY_DN2362_c0_g1~~TRINITY_DN2362_c0_g1_i3.p1  ORF type:complete len:192 (+),score=20.07 TRINITY_DN2362_c0_g1_i3:221-796(+)
MCKYVSRRGVLCKRYGNHDGYCLRHSKSNKEPIEPKKNINSKTKIIQENIPEAIPEHIPEVVPEEVNVLPSKPKLQKTNKLSPVEQIQPVQYSNRHQLSKYDVKHYVKKYVKKKLNKSNSDEILSVTEDISKEIEPSKESDVSEDEEVNPQKTKKVNKYQDNTLFNNLLENIRSSRSMPRPIPFVVINKYE